MHGLRRPSFSRFTLKPPNFNINLLLYTQVQCNDDYYLRWLNKLSIINYFIIVVELVLILYFSHLVRHYSL